MNAVPSRKALEEAGNDIEKAMEIIRKKGQAVAVGHQVQAFCRISCKNNFTLGSGMQEFPHSLSGILVGVRGRHAQFVQPSERVGIAVLIKLLLRFHHTDRPLGRGRIVQINHVRHAPFFSVLH